ncbi:MAG: GrpB family protein [Alphaproteobacteria bacterium]|nr:GrpB family protein [Alphaproteobacteria bacterium]
MSLIEISPSDPTWSTQFQALRASLLLALPAGAVIHHIGSTAVPDLPAKDIIDIQVTLDDLATADITAITAAGFATRPGAPRTDHCPPGLDLPPEELAKLFFKSTGRPAHLHIRQTGRFNQRYPLLCRDYLRSHPGAARAYAEIKQKLAQRFPDDVEAYYDIKDPVFDIIMAGANDWAASIGWTTPPGD